MIFAQQNNWLNRQSSLNTVQLLTFHKPASKSNVAEYSRDGRHIFPAQHSRQNRIRWCILECTRHLHSIHSRCYMNTCLALYNYLFRTVDCRRAHKTCELYPTRSLACKRKHCPCIRRFHSLERVLFFNANSFSPFHLKFKSIGNSPMGQVGTQNPAKFFTWSG